MALAIDPSSPAVATGNQTATTASFTPPAGSTLLIGFSGNNDDWPQFPTVPTITDNLGGHLTYTIWDWQCGGLAGASASGRPSTGHEGQTAFWTAPVITSAPMTVSVTNNTTLGQSQCAVNVWVLTGVDGGTPVGAHGFNGSSSGSTVAQSYTAQIDEGQGFLAVCDWSAVGTETAGSGCTFDASGSIGAPDVSYGFTHRSVADDSNGGLTTLNMSLPSSSTSYNWSYIELQPGVADPAEKDPPPFINFYAPGGLAPNGVPTPWAGTANAAPDATGLIIHGSSPLTALNTAGTATGLTTASFTPPANSLLLILWSGNSIDPNNPSTPTITDSLGVPLTYTLSDWQSRADSPTVDGQAAAWTAPVTSAAPMTVTVNNNAASPNRHAALTVLVLTDASGSRPTIGAHGKSGSTSASIIAQSYTAQATGGQGFLSLCDWNAVGTPTQGTDCYPAREGSAGTIPTQISWGHFKRTAPDDVNATANRLNVSLPATTAEINWVYIEILPAVVVTSSPSAQPLVVTPPFTPVPVPPFTLSASQPLGNPAVGTAGPLVVSPAHVVIPPPPVRLFSPTAVATTPGALIVTPPYVPVPIPPVSITASQPLGNPAVGTPGPVVVSAPWAAKVPGAQLFSNPAAPTVVSTATPNVLVVGPPYTPAPIPGARIWSTAAVAVTPQPLVVTPPFTPVPVPPVSITASQPLGNPAVPTPQVLVVTAPWTAPVPGAKLYGPGAPPAVVSTVGTTSPLVIGPPFTPVPIPLTYLSASQPLGNPAVGSPQPLVVTPTFTLAPVPGAKVFATPSTPATPATPTPGPLVVVPPWRPVPIPKMCLSANFPLGNPATASPQPLVVGPPQRWPISTASLLAAAPPIPSVPAAVGTLTPSTFGPVLTGSSVAGSGTSYSTAGSSSSSSAPSGWLTPTSTGGDT